MSGRLRAIAKETLELLESGRYPATDAAVAGTRLYLPDDPLPARSTVDVPVVEVTRESTLVAARRLAGDGPVAALNFASARNPGGGFLGGAQAQEESIARASGLYPCLSSVFEFYEHHRAEKDLRYSDRVIYSPRVPVFRDDKGRLIDPAYEVSFLTAAAPNNGAVLRSQPANAATVPAVLERRARRVLDVAAAHGERRLVLGAWGCGVFRNDPAVVAEAFATVLGGFDHVVFAVLDHVSGTPVYNAFAERFGAPRAV
ncbi:TIGR02452 family protein [Virgisporangium aliadipatigenens]|uniref:TIGR02452 family protein n=1 Tax=Virgisporangium aliadipatigenens TaxID=741659 RepID=UPI0019444D42|nr:TIGR02452 family protein [Virgisporangium aliadipatigenens]